MQNLYARLKYKNKRMEIDWNGRKNFYRPQNRNWKSKLMNFYARENEIDYFQK